MRIALLEIYPNKKINFDNAIDAHLRNAITLQKCLGAELLCIEDDYKRAIAKEKKYDALCLCYGSFYAPFQLIKRLCEINKDASKIVFTNEYNIAPSIGGFKPYHWIANFTEPEKLSRNVLSFSHINLNLLLSKTPNEIIEKTHDCIYYGTFRVNREKYFRKYLQNDIYLSTSPQNFKKYKRIGCNPEYIKKLSWKRRRETLNNFRFSLYIEDDYTHTHFNNLANRWYEAGFCNNIMLFDEACRSTIMQSELAQHIDEVENYMVYSYEQMKDKMQELKKDFTEHLYTQRRWRTLETVHKTECIHAVKSSISEAVEADNKAEVV